MSGQRRWPLKMTAFGVTRIELGSAGCRTKPPRSSARIQSCHLRTAFASHTLCSAPPQLSEERPRTKPAMAGAARKLRRPGLPPLVEARPGHLSTSHTEPCTASSRKPALPGLRTPASTTSLKVHMGWSHSTTLPGRHDCPNLFFRGHATWHVESPHLTTRPHPLQGVREGQPPRAGREGRPCSRQQAAPAPLRT